MSVEDVLTNAIDFRWDEASQRLFVTDATRAGSLARIAQIEFGTLDKMTLQEASAFIGNFVVLLMPALRSRFANELGEADESDGKTNA